MLKVFDAHFHIVDYRYAIVPNRGYVPPEFTVSNYLSYFENVELLGGILVAGSFHGSDYAGIIAALEELGEGFYGVINPPDVLSRALVEDLHHRGIRGVRFNLKRLGMELAGHMTKIADKLWEWAGWHVDVYVENSRLKEIKGILRDLPLVVIDHLGLTREGFEDLLELVELGVYVKVSGFGRLDFDPFWALSMIKSISPYACIFATDLPSTRAPEPFSWDHIDRIAPLVDEDLLYRNALRLVGGGA